jgi:predicted phosphodiesterase
VVLAVIFTLGTGRNWFLESPPEERETGPTKFAIGLIGDTPYSAEEQRKTDVLFRRLEDEKLAFVIHVGDIKSSSSPCTDEVFLREKERFEGLTHPLVYVPGDNDWSDCYLSGYDPVERLDRLREIFFVGEESLGQETIPLTRQSAAYPENVRWTYGDVTFVGLNVPGPNNNRGRDPEEYAARNEANLRWIQEGFDRAEASGSSAVMISMQANPGFDRPPDKRTGYNDLLTTLQRETVAFGKPVVLVHGDTHTYRLDGPMTSTTTGRRVDNFTRVETFGSPDVNWVRASVDTSSPEVFAFQPEIIEENTVEEEP